jgi:hypothetical protein
MKNLELKSVLEDILKIQTKFLTEDDGVKDEITIKAKRSRKQKKLSPEEQEKRREEIRNSGNPNLNYHTMLSCSNGQIYVSPKIDYVQENVKIPSSEWLAEQKRLEKENKVNYFTACDYQARIMKNQNRLGDKTQDDTFLDCLTLCYSILQSLPEKCTSTFKFEKSENEVLTVSLGIGNWWGAEYSKYLSDETYKTKSPWEVVSKRDYYYWDGKTYQKFSFSGIIDTEDGDLEQTTVTFGEKTKMEMFLPLTDSEKQVMSENPFSEDGEFKEKGTQICKKPTAPKVNLRTSAGVNNDNGFFDPTDNYITWTSMEHLGTLLEKRFMWRGQPLVNNSPNNKIKQLLDKYISQKVYPDTNMLVTTLERMYQDNAKVAENISKMNRLQLDNFFLSFTPLNFSKYPKEFQEDILKSKIGEIWYKIKVPKSFKDLTDVASTIFSNDEYDTVWVSAQTTEVCQSKDPEKVETDYSVELLKRAPIKALKAPNEDVESGFKGEGPRIYNPDGYGF